LDEYKVEKVHYNLIFIRVFVRTVCAARGGMFGSVKKSIFTLLDLKAACGGRWERYADYEQNDTE